jgi:uncharacterized protein
MSPARDAELDATVLAARGGTIDRTFSLASLPRIAALDAGEGSRVVLQGRFGLADGRVTVTGWLRGQVELRCQRCLGRVSVPIRQSLDLVVVDSEEAMAEVGESTEAIVADATRLDVAWLAEEEILLALPLVPMHDVSSTDCVAREPETTDEVGESGEPDRQTPFAKLRDLLDKS